MSADPNIIPVDKRPRVTGLVKVCPICRFGFSAYAFKRHKAVAHQGALNCNAA